MSPFFSPTRLLFILLARVVVLYCEYDVDHKTTNIVILWDLKNNSELKFKNIFMKSLRAAVLFFFRGV